MRMFPRIAFIVLLVAGCQLSQTAGAAVTTASPEAVTTAEVTAAATPESAAPTTVLQAPTATPVDSSSLMVWLNKGSDPTHASGGQIGLIDRSGAVTPLMDVPGDATRVTACGDQATSPDGRFFALYMGGDSGSLYLTDGTQAPTLVDKIAYLACLDGLRYAPNSSRFGFIDFPAAASRNEYASGTLRIISTDALKEMTHIDDVVAFDMDNSGAVFVKFFTNNRNEADEASVNLWDGSSEHEVVTVVPTDPSCRFTSAQVGINSANLLLLMGQRCSGADARTRWQLYTVDAANGSATLAGSDYQPGGFVTFARTNNLYFSPDGSTAYFTVPDGVTGYTVAVAAVNLSDMSISVPIGRQAVFPNFSGAPNAFPRLSPDGRWLAMVVTSPNGDNQLLSLDLNTPSSKPLGGTGTRSRGDTVPNVAFAPDSSKVYYVAGSADNALFSLDLGLGTERRIVRGKFVEGMALAPEGHTVALLNTTTASASDQPPYLDLVLADVTSGDLTTLYEGADIVDGKVTNARFAYPLTWRK